MESFEELGISPSLVEALAAEGIENPTLLQTEAVPVLRRGHSAVLRGGPGAGALIAFGVPLLDRLDAGDAEGPSALVLTSSGERAGELALSLARLALGSDHRVGALGGPWALPERASILFATPTDLEQALRSSQVKLEGIQALVIDGAGPLLDGPDAERIERLLSGLTVDPLQLVLVSEPLTAALRAFADRHMRRAVFIPSDSASVEETGESLIQRGLLRVCTAEGDREAALVTLVAELLGEGHAHVLLFVRSADRAVDLGDLLGLHGFLAGAPGDAGVPVWLGTDPLEAREALPEEPSELRRIAVVSVDVPTDADDLDRRHGGPLHGGTVLALPRELPHLRRTSRQAGYSLESLPARGLSRLQDSTDFLLRLERVLEEEDLLPTLLLLEPSIRRWGAAEVAAALTLLLRQKAPLARSPEASTAPTATANDERAGPRPQAWIRLFLSVGERDGIGAGDLLGAILGESGISGDQVGRIDLKDTFAKVEVHETVADQVIRALNGTSIRGRSVRADFDRGDSRPRQGAPSRGPGKGGPGRSGPAKGGGVRKGSGGKPRSGGSGPPRT